MATKPRHLKTPIQLWVMDNRKRLGLSSKDLADLTGVDEDTARGWESRGRPSEDALLVLRQRFGVPIPEDAPPPGDLAALTAQISRLVDVIERDRAERTELRAKVEALEGIVNLLRVPPSGASNRAPVAPGQ